MYDRALHNRIIWPALQNSLIVAISTAVVSALLGTPAAFIHTRRSSGSVSCAVLVLPLSLPTFDRHFPAPLLCDAVLTRSLLTSDRPRRLLRAVHMLLVVSARLAEFDSHPGSRRDLGATPETFRESRSR